MAGINLLKINGQSLVISCQPSVTVMEQKRANVSHCRSGSLNEGTKKNTELYSQQLTVLREFPKAHGYLDLFPAGPNKI